MAWGVRHVVRCSAMWSSIVVQCGVQYNGERNAVRRVHYRVQVLYDSVQCGMVQCNAVQCVCCPMQCNVVRAMQWLAQCHRVSALACASAMWFSTMRYGAV